VTTLTINIRFGRSDKRSGYDSSANAVAQKFEKQLRAAVLKAEKKIVASNIPELQDAIVRNVECDLRAFARQVVTYFMSVRFSNNWETLRGGPRKGMQALTNGSPRVISMDEVEDAGDRGMMTELSSEVVRSARSAPESLVWPGLAASTIYRKTLRQGAASVYYFNWSGQLHDEIRAAFGDLLADLIEPSIIFTTSAESAAGPFQRGKKLGSVKVRLFKSWAGAGILGNAFASGDWAQAKDDDTLLYRYMSADIAKKLGHPSNGENAKRPWVGPSIAYWAIMRFPYIVEQSIRDTLKSHRASVNGSEASAQFQGV
jgi:hypothetical protein